MVEALTIIAAIFGVCGFSVLAAWRWFSDHRLVVSKHSPTRPVISGQLSFIDVQLGIDLLVDDAKAYAPDIIFGINRGGSIVAGMLAKRLSMPGITILEVNCDHPDGQRVIEQRAVMTPLVGRALLVDDAKRKGEHMREAFAYLRHQYPQVEIRRLVVLELIHPPHQGPETMAFHATRAERAAFNTDNASVLLPWDP